MNIAFVLGQIGLAMAALCSIGIIHITASSPTRPPWYYYVTVWAVACACVFVACEPFSDPENHVPLSNAAYALRLLFGIERFAVLYFYRTRQGVQLQPRVIYIVNTWAGGIAVLALALMFGYGMYAEMYAKVDSLEAQTQQAKSQTRLTAAVLVKKLEARNDSLSAEHTKDRAVIDKQDKEITVLKQQFDTLIDLIIELQRNINRLSGQVARNSANVDRIERTVKTPKLVPYRQPPPEMIDPTRVHKHTPR